MSTIVFDRWELGLDLRKQKELSDANRLRVLDNAFVTTGRDIQKRPGMRKVAVLEPGTIGLASGLEQLQTFYGLGSVSHANPLFHANEVLHPTSPQNLRSTPFIDVFKGFLYAVIEFIDASIYHYYYDGGAPRVTDANAVPALAGIKADNHIWVVKDDTVRFCAAAAARDWTAVDDAGFISVGQQQSGSAKARGLGLFQSRLIVFFEDGSQTWNIDEDPEKNSIEQKITGTGTRYPRSVANFSADCFFLSDTGFRSIRVNEMAPDNALDIDVGNPIDTLVKAFVKTFVGTPLGIWAPGMGQYWCCMGSIAWVFTYSRTGKLQAWSRYTFPFSIDAITSLANQLYLRSGDNVYVADDAYYTDDGVPIAVRAELPFLDFKLPGNEKMIWGADVVVDGTADLAFRFNPNNESLITSAVTIVQSSDPGSITPVEVTATNISPVVTHERDEAFRLSRLEFYYNDLGPK